MRVSHSALLALIGAVALLLGACQTLPSDAPRLSTASTAALPSASAPLPQGVPQVDPPPGFFSFCMRFADQCQSADNEPSSLHLTSEVWGELQSVNARVNDSIWPVDDERHYGRAEYWTIPTDGYGDCEDYALTKRQQLGRLGLPMKALRVAVVITGRNNRHAVLTIATDDGDFVLDNETSAILPWDQTGYRWVARQDAKNDWGWVNLETPSFGLAMATGENRTDK